MAYPEPIQKLITEFNKLPGIGTKTSQRFVFYLLKKPKVEIEKMIQALNELKNNIKYCSTCQNFSQSDPCPICADEKRDKTILCLVANPQNLEVIEKTGGYNGLYHVLHGTIDIAQSITPENLKVRQLINRLKSQNYTKEIIFAFNPDVEGESTTIYLSKLLKPFNLKLSRLARGIPMGGDLEYADEITIENALKGRNEV